MCFQDTFWLVAFCINVGQIYIFCFFPPAATEAPVMVTRAQTITVADESLVLVISWLTPRLLGLQAHTVNADTEGNEKITQSLQFRSGLRAGIIVWRQRFNFRPHFKSSKVRYKVKLYLFKVYKLLGKIKQCFNFTEFGV